MDLDCKHPTPPSMGRGADRRRRGGFNSRKRSPVLFLPPCSPSVGWNGVFCSLAVLSGLVLALSLAARLWRGEAPGVPSVRGRRLRLLGGGYGTPKPKPTRAARLGVNRSHCAAPRSGIG